jgi:hypothetical protein
MEYRLRFGWGWNSWYPGWNWGAEVVGAGILVTEILGTDIILIGVLIMGWWLLSWLLRLGRLSGYWGRPANYKRSGVDSISEEIILIVVLNRSGFNRVSQIKINLTKVL